MKSKEEKLFKVEVIASIVEFCFLTKPEEVFKFCSYVTGVEVHPGNMREHYKNINSIIKEQYPNMERKIFLEDGCVLKPHQIIEIVNKYKEEYGEHLLIKRNYTKKLTNN